MSVDDRDSETPGFQVVDRRRLVMGGLAAAAGVGVVASAAAPAAAANGGPVLLGTSNTASATTKVSTTGGHGLQASSSATGGYGVLATSTKANAIFGQSAAAGYTAVLGKNTNTTTGGWGVRGLAGTKGTGVRGETSDYLGDGVHGINFGTGSGSGAGVRGDGEEYGVRGSAYGYIGTGVTGDASGEFGVGVRAYSSGSSGVGLSGYAPNGGTGVYASGTAYGVHATAPGYGIYSTATGTNGTALAGEGTNGYGVYGKGSVRAALFDGTVEVRGTLVKSAGSFRIDHPLDPANKYLSHSFVESPDMMNIYNGIVVLDGQGRATVEMPDWFDALNSDFRYQLTAIGGAAPDLHVSSEIEGRAFTIAGGSKDLKVSWQVTGIRQDAWALANRIPVEHDKPADLRGKYLHPELIKGGGKPMFELPKPPRAPEPPKPNQPRDMHVPVR